MLSEDPGFSNWRNEPEAIAKFAKLDIITGIIRCQIINFTGFHEYAKKCCKMVLRLICSGRYLQPVCPSHPAQRPGLRRGSTVQAS